MQRSQLLGGGVTAIVGAALVLGALTMTPSSAQVGDGARPDSTCNNSTACVEWTNSGTGHAFKGTAPSNDGIVGVTDTEYVPGIRP